jgi:hypothetical protein
MSTRNIQRIGQWPTRETIHAVNRTGTARTRGDVVALDLTGSDGDVNTYAAQMALMSASTESHPLANFIAPATAHLEGWVFGLVLNETVANDAVAELLIVGLGVAKIAAGDTSNPAIAAGKGGRPTNGQYYLSAVADGSVNVALALEAGNVAATVATKTVLFNGIQFNTHGG